MLMARLVSLALVLPWCRASLPTYDAFAMEPLGAFAPGYASRRSPDAPLGAPLGGASTVLPGARLAAWHRVLARLARREQAVLTVLVLGGSMTAGRMDARADRQQASLFAAGARVAYGSSACANATTTESYATCDHEVTGDCKPCAFPARLGAWLARVYPATDVRVLNYAVGASTSRSILGMLGGELEALEAGHVDVAFVNYVDNDVARATDAAATAKIAAAHEALLRLLLTRKVAVVDVEMQVPDKSDAWPTHAAVCRHLGVPMVSWRRGVAGDEKSSVARHPNWAFHQLIADWLAYEWGVQGAAALRGNVDASDPPLPPPLRSPDTSDVVSDVVCAAPLTDLDAHELAASPAAVSSDGAWRFGEDAPGKKGWIVDDAHGGVVNFTVHTPPDGKDPVVGVGFLASWDPSMGAVRVVVDGDAENAAVLNASRPGGTASQTEYARLCVEPPRYSPCFPACGAPTKRPLRFAAHKPASCDRDQRQCESAWRRYDAAQRASTARSLSFELLPRPGAASNRFVLRYVVTC
ncbi:cGMP-dependent protein kinase [Aureococcus anophagefferens]|uniref:cGMP-dependent protein kinase n=1 Tax=Aureococcus anophagefferens TaxID=44056 RepID=A0ABR1FLN5_AURAN